MQKSLPVILVGIALFLTECTTVWAGGLELGVGFAFPDSRKREGREVGWDVTLGYEFIDLENLNLGLQLQLISGWTEDHKINSFADPEDMTFNSKALYITARPAHEWFKWLQFKIGAVEADYKTNIYENEGSGFAYGAGIVIGDEKFRLHFMDVQRYRIDDDTFDVFSITVLILMGL
jgi:hypothetical protein